MQKQQKHKLVSEILNGFNEDVRRNRGLTAGLLVTSIANRGQ